MFQDVLRPIIYKETTVLTVEKKTLTVVLPFLGNLFLQTRTKLQNVLKRILGCCKIQITFESLTESFKCFPFQRSFTLRTYFSCGL